MLFRSQAPTLLASAQGAARGADLSRMAARSQRSLTLLFWFGRDARAAVGFCPGGRHDCCLTHLWKRFICAGFSGVLALGDPVRGDDCRATLNAPFPGPAGLGEARLNLRV